MKLKLYYPLSPCTVSQVFGVNEGADYKAKLGFIGHPGSDLISHDIKKNNISYGRNVRASHDGRVLSIETDKNGGYTIVLLTDKAYDYKDRQTYFKSIYAHCIPNSAKVKEGQSVKTGDILALCGVSGILPNGEAPHDKAHVHFSIKPAGYLTPDGQNAYWHNSEQDNGYGGAIDDAPYQTGISAIDCILENTPIVSPIEVPAPPILIQEVGLLTKVVQLLIKLFTRK